MPGRSAIDRCACRDGDNCGETGAAIFPTLSHNRTLENHHHGVRYAVAVGPRFVKTVGPKTLTTPTLYLGYVCIIGVHVVRTRAHS
jgi:hypothetical protein